MNGKYLAISGRIRRELEDIAMIVKRTVNIWKQAKQSSDDYYIDATALNLHSFYTGIERILENIANGIDQTVPTGAHWHYELLQQMTAKIKDIRPPVLSVETRKNLDAYRGFRHVVRNVYTFNLDINRVGALINNLQTTMEKVSQELTAFADFLEQAGSKQEL
ncbi:HepT-like domain-containing protein [Candidatus Magnetomoraceae bacterium gMMP-15]